MYEYVIWMNRQITELNDWKKLNWISTWTWNENHLNFTIRYAIKNIVKIIYFTLWGVSLTKNHYYEPSNDNSFHPYCKGHPIPCRGIEWYCNYGSRPSQRQWLVAQWINAILSYAGYVVLIRFLSYKIL